MARRHGPFRADLTRVFIPPYINRAPSNWICRWCEGEIWPRNENNPAVIGRLWHRECWLEHKLYTSKPAQVRFVTARDGPDCFKCKRAGGRLQLDHDTPLWSVEHLPEDQRRAYFYVTNLHLLCKPCHTKKSIKEAHARKRFRAKNG